MKRELLYQNGYLAVWQDQENGHIGVEKRRDRAVAILVYLSDQDAVIMVEQRRSPMVSTENPSGLIREVPAGHIEDGETPRATIKKELREEIGASVEEDNIVFPNDLRFLASSPGFATERKLMAYVEITSDQLEAGQCFGNASEGEATKRILVPRAELTNMPCHDLATWALIQWFLRARQ